MMADQLFNDTSTVGSTADIPDIFDVLEGGEDEGAVRYLLGFNGDEGGVGLLGQVDTFGGLEVMDKFVGDGINLALNGGYLSGVTTSPSPTTILQDKTIVRQIPNSLNNKKRDTSGAKAIHNCYSCGKCFTTKFNLKRHINMHCHKSKENGVPIQGPPSASAPAKKSDKPVPKAETHISNLQQTTAETHPTSLQAANPQTVLNQNHALLHSGPGVVPYSRVVTVPQTEYQRTEPDSTYKLPSVQTILPVSTVYTSATSFSTIASCDSSQTVSSVTSSSHNTDFGTLPADLFDPDSPRSEPPTPTSPSGKKLTENEPEEEAPAPVTLTSIPAGWTRKISHETGLVSYYSPLGKIFFSHEEIVQYFKTFNFTVPLGLFDFQAQYYEDSEDEDESDEEDEDYDESEEEEDEGESICAKRRRSEAHFQSFESMSPPFGTSPSPVATPSSSPLA